MTYEDALAILRDGWPITPEDLTQIAADIWEQGAESGWQATGEGWNGEYANGTTHDGAQSFRDAGNDTTNHYRTQETA